MNNKGFAAIALLVLVAFFFVGNIIAAYGSVEHVTVTLNRQPENRCITSGTANSGVSTRCFWFVYTDKEVFKNSDSILFFKFNSADVANGLQPGKTYCIKVNMFRVPFLSMFRNVLGFQEGPCSVTVGA